MKNRFKKILTVMSVFLMVFTSMNLAVFAETGDTDLSGWEFAAFGSNTGSDKNPPPTIHDDGSVTIDAAGGKIASSEEGLSYYFTKLPADANFEIHTTASADAYSPDGQRSFGLMLKDAVGEDGDSGKHAANYVAVGALDDAMRGFYSQGGIEKLDAFSENVPPATGETYELSIRKSGDTFVVTSNGESEVFSLDGAFSEDIYVGFYVARNGTVTFSDTSLDVANKVVKELNVNAQDMKTEYLVDESLDLSGLEVTAIYGDGSEEVLAEDDYIVNGFDSSQAGTNTVMVSYNGAETPLDLTIRELQLTGMEIKYYPAKTAYYPKDEFDPEGLVVLGDYDNGYQVIELDEEQYSFVIDGEEVEEDGYQFDNAGTFEVTIQSIANPDISTSFEVKVENAAMEKLEITQLPAKTQYFLGDELDLDGIVVQAEYSDGYSERLMKDQFEVSELDTNTTGDKEVAVSYKGQEATFTVNVKEKELQGIQLAEYPKTTYQVGEDFDSAGVAIAKVYDNGEEELLDESAYELDTSSFDGSQAGVYPVEVNPNDDSISSITFDVTVREHSEPEWKTIQFGQSSGSDTNYVDFLGDGSINIVAKPAGAGKITGDHDGITFYYTEIDAEQDNFELTADIKVNEYAKTPNHDGQESFGIMARDAIGTNDDDSVFASNIAAVGGFSGGTQEKNGTQLFVRTGVESSDGAGSEGIQKQMLKDEKPETSNTYPVQDYRLTLSKTNSGFTAQLNDGQEAIFFEPEILNVQDSKIYVGFYTARLADIEVSNIDFNVSAQATDAPRVEPPEEPVEPGFEIVSRDKSSETDYELLLKSNVDGVATIKQGQEVIAQDQQVSKGELSAIAADLPKNEDTNFSITFLPDDTQFLTSYDKQVKNFTVSMKTFNETGDIHVTPEGTSGGDGSTENPLDLDTAVEYVLPGQKIILADGDYVRHSKLEIAKYNDGTADAMKYLVAEEGATPVVDFDKRSEGVVLSGDYWHVKGIDFARSAGNTKGFTIGGSHNIVEASRFYENGDTGLQISRTDGEAPREEWPSDNLILNSESFDNRDPSDNNADGFAAKLTSGDNNVFRGCIAHHNIDDGWDLYTKVGTGAIGPVLIEDSIAYSNGYLTDGTEGDGDKNGFKLGGEGVHVPHTIKDSLAFENGAVGFSSNSNPGVIAENNTSFNNAGGNIDFSTYANIEEDFTIDGFISYQKDYDVTDSYPEDAVSADNFFFDGTVSKNSSGVVLTDENFASLQPELPFDRDEEGNIILGDFLQFQVNAQADITPPVINKHKGQNETGGPKAAVYIKLQEGFNLRDIKIDSVRLNGELEPLKNQKKNPVVDYDEDGELELKVQFSRNKLASTLETGEQEVSVTGQLNSGLPFETTVTVTVK
ncbi:hypothetical protein GCM10007216_13350 [Thalassobacillus devorans]|uniref:Ig-like protein group 3 n=1 Tax=Thalassobacillus devorans TaxID=279813 RepID=A0ABQ1NV40_9BACI|nr:bacterial Ig-like domain-containing protein [Thalassobacillus devorans]NIK28724.1 hypothetical protein [Thalassobacillus devorans]GGC84045.1 hypothetical protein GCM10007216_13350 [Thalassobacillus devorans]